MGGLTLPLDGGLSRGLDFLVPGGGGGGGGASYFEDDFSSYALGTGMPEGWLVAHSSIDDREFGIKAVGGSLSGQVLYFLCIDDFLSNRGHIVWTTPGTGGAGQEILALMTATNRLQGLGQAELGEAPDGNKAYAGLNSLVIMSSQAGDEYHPYESQNNGGFGAQFGASNVALTITQGSRYWFRVRRPSTNNEMYAKVWEYGTSEPGSFSTFPGNDPDNGVMPSGAYPAIPYEIRETTPYNELQVEYIAVEPNYLTNGSIPLPV